MGRLLEARGSVFGRDSPGVLSQDIRDILGNTIVAETGGGGGGTGEKYGRGVAGGATRTSVQGQGIRQMGLNVRAADGKREPGNVQVYRCPWGGVGWSKGVGIGEGGGRGVRTASDKNYSDQMTKKDWAGRYKVKY